MDVSVKLGAPIKLQRWLLLIKKFNGRFFFCCCCPKRFFLLHCDTDTFSVVFFQVVFFFMTLGVNLFGGVLYKVGPTGWFHQDADSSSPPG